MGAADPVWEERITRMTGLSEQIATLEQQRIDLATEFEGALADYERLIREHQLPVEVPCGFRPSAHRGEARNGDAIFWKFASIDTEVREVIFRHRCGYDHYAGCNHPHQEELAVPLLFFIDRSDWPLLTALAGQAAH